MTERAKGAKGANTVNLASLGIPGVLRTRGDHEERHLDHEERHEGRHEGRHIERNNIKGLYEGRQGRQRVSGRPPESEPERGVLREPKSATRFDALTLLNPQRALVERDAHDGETQAELPGLGEGGEAYEVLRQGPGAAGAARARASASASPRRVQTHREAES